MTLELAPPPGSRPPRPRRPTSIVSCGCAILMGGLGLSAVIVALGWAYSVLHV